MSVKVRFAPSPTGRLHVGNIRPAVLNWLFQRRHGGTFLLRLDDTDQGRSTAAFADGIVEDMRWLGLSWDAFLRQSDRLERYAAAAERLKAAGRLYPCYETADELDRRRKRQLARGLPPIYDRAALRLTGAETAKLAAEGRRPHWRFRLTNSSGPDDLAPRPTPVAWDDLIRGHQTVDAGSLSDPVLVREDGTFLYTFTSVVDDIETAITHIIRGEDHVTNTGVQIQLFEALGARPPAFAHHSLLVQADGSALSKRLGALSIEGLRKSGLEPEAVVCHAALVGTSDAIEPRATLDDLAKSFDLGKISRAPGRFDENDLHALNARLLHMLPFERVSARLAALGVSGGAPFWLTVRGNLAVLADAKRWHDIVYGPIAPTVESPDVLKAAADRLPAAPWDADTWSPAGWSAYTAAIKAATGASGRALFHPLRIALTGEEKGPELRALMPLMGRERVAARLRVAQV
ncbi:MAG TPA: glutamate--tRNA ligase [Hyphomicrobiaceae bacterium]|nr:glutamate--tRNA ligase [Hyphomicrobiaceae bacterium]